MNARPPSPDPRPNRISFDLIRRTRHTTDTSNDILGIFLPLMLSRHPLATISIPAMLKLHSLRAGRRDDAAAPHLHGNDCIYSDIGFLLQGSQSDAVLGIGKRRQKSEEQGNREKKSGTRQRDT